MYRRGRRSPRPVVGDPSDPRGLAVRLAEYLDHLRVRNYSPNTVKSRDAHLREFVRWCTERGIMRPTEVTRPILERYQRTLYHRRKRSGAPLSFRTQRILLQAVRAFFKYLARGNVILYNPAAELELPKPAERLPKHVLTPSEADRVINLADSGDLLGLRDRAILETLYSTGMRRLELAALRVYDLDSDRGTVMVRQGKGRKDRMIPIGSRALAWIDRYLVESRPHLVARSIEQTLFLTADGEPISPGRLTVLVGRYVRRAELGKTGSCHLFRHTMATVMLEAGADIRFIQQMLGHVNLETTQVYTRVSIRKLKQIHEATHPARLERRRST